MSPTKASEVVQLHVDALNAGEFAQAAELLADAFVYVRDDVRLNAAGYLALSDAERSLLPTATVFSGSVRDVQPWMAAGDHHGRSHVFVVDGPLIKGIWDVKNWTEWLLRQVDPS